MRVVSPLLKHAVFPGLAKLGYLRRRNGAGPAIVTYHGIVPQGYKMIDPDLDGIRDDPRCRELFRRMKLPEW